MPASGPAPIMSSRKAAPSRLPLPIFKRSPVDVNIQAPSTDRSCRMVPLKQHILALTLTTPLAYSMLTDYKDRGDDENSQRASDSRSILPVRGCLVAQSFDLLKGAVYSNHPWLQRFKQKPQSGTRRSIPPRTAGRASPFSKRNNTGWEGRCEAFTCQHKTRSKSATGPFGLCIACCQDSHSGYSAALPAKLTWRVGRVSESRAALRIQVPSPDRHKFLI
jgi:hypothetical protein